MISQAPEFPRKFLMDDGLCRDNQVSEFATRFRDSQVSESPATSARQGGRRTSGPQKNKHCIAAFPVVSFALAPVH